MKGIGVYLGMHLEMHLQLETHMGLKIRKVEEKTSKYQSIFKTCQKMDGRHF